MERMKNETMYSLSRRIKARTENSVVRSIPIKSEVRITYMSVQCAILSDDMISMRS